VCIEVWILDEWIFEFAGNPRGMAHAARVLIHGREPRIKERLAYWAVTSKGELKPSRMRRDSHWPNCKKTLK
jgi:hypothetical protein